MFLPNGGSIATSAMNGDVFSASIESTNVGGAGAGTYSLSLFNPSGSGKNLLLVSITMSVNYGQAYGRLYQESSNPLLATTVTPLNRLVGGAASVISATCSAYSNPVSDQANQLVTPILNAEYLNNGSTIVVPPGKGILVTTFVDNSQPFGYCATWIEI